MKIKLLLAPSLLVIAAAMFIWMVYPAYTNGIDGVKENHKKLKEKKLLAAKLNQRYENVMKLASELDADTSEKNTIFSYIPNEKEDEKIIDSLNSTALKNELTVLNISLADIREEIVPAEEIVDPSALGGEILPDGTVAVAEVDVDTPLPFKVVNPRKLAVKFSVLGKYDKEIALLDSLYKMKRFNKVSALEIKTTKKEDQSLSDDLVMNIELEFVYLADKYNVADGDINTDLFFNGVFNRDVLASINKNKSIDMNSVLPGEAGKNNPFFLTK